MSRNEAMHRAKSASFDEYYTQYDFIASELPHYRHHFRDKIVYCNCDDPAWSNFYRYFKDSFHDFGLRRLTATCLDRAGGRRADYDGARETAVPLAHSGDFRSPECQDIMAAADVVVTNPPFSLFNEFMLQLIAFGKDFLVVGNVTGLHYKAVRPLVARGEIWLGSTRRGTWFRVPPDFKAADGVKTMTDAAGNLLVEIPQSMWFTNLDYEYRHRRCIEFAKQYDPAGYPRFDNYDAINVDEVKDIPDGWYGEMGVPESFLAHHSPAQFQVVGHDMDLVPGGFRLDGKHKYVRLVIRRLK